MTLVEVLIAATVLSLLLTSLCGIYSATATQWERQQGERDALTATSQACSRLDSQIRQAVEAYILKRFHERDTLVVNMPKDTAYGVYVPTQSGGQMVYRSGTWIVFYLSDSSGSYSKNGDILWAATFPNQLFFPSNLTPDASWSLQPGRSIGRASPLADLVFGLKSDGDLPLVTITAKSSYKTGRTSETITKSRTVCLRNAGK
jgi:hypothetical protein